MPQHPPKQDVTGTGNADQSGWLLGGRGQSATIGASKSPVAGTAKRACLVNLAVLQDGSNSLCPSDAHLPAALDAALDPRPRNTDGIPRTDRCDGFGPWKVEGEDLWHMFFCWVVFSDPSLWIHCHRTSGSVRLDPPGAHINSLQIPSEEVRLDQILYSGAILGRSPTHDGLGTMS